MGMKKPNPIQFKENTMLEPFPGAIVSDEGGSYDVDMANANNATQARIEATIDLATSDDKPLKVTLINYPVFSLTTDEWLQDLYFYNISAIVLITPKTALDRRMIDEKQAKFDKYWSLVQSIYGDCDSWPRFNDNNTRTSH